MKHIFLLCPRFLICAGKIIDSHFVPIPSLRRTIPELYRFLLCAEHICTNIARHAIYMYTVISFKTNETVKEPDTSLSSPNNITMRKNITDQNGAPGINVNALGYAINAKPGPEEQYQWKQLSRVMRQPAFCIGENKDADQLRCNRDTGQRLCFRYTHSTIPLLSKSEISSP